MSTRSDFHRIEPVPKDVLRTMRKLILLPEEARECRFAVPVTRLTVLKSLSRDTVRARRFLVFLARKTLERVEQGQGRSSHPTAAAQQASRKMMTDALAGMEAFERKPSDGLRRDLEGLLRSIAATQQKHEKIPFGVVRLIGDWDLLLVEDALRGVLASPDEIGHWAYRIAKHYAERYDSSHGSGLTSASAPALQEIADFWMEEFGLTSESLHTSPEGRKLANSKSTASVKSETAEPKIRFTPRQGQFLAFIHLYRRLHRRGPAELDLVRFFGITPPAAHGMVVKLEEAGLVTRERGVARSLRVAIPDNEIPSLEDVEGAPW